MMALWLPLYPKLDDDVNKTPGPQGLCSSLLCLSYQWSWTEASILRGARATINCLVEIKVRFIERRVSMGCSRAFSSSSQPTI